MVAEFVLYGNRTILFKSFVSASFLHVLLLNLSPCHRFRPFRCTFLRFVIFSPHSSLLAFAVTAAVLRVLLLLFLCLALFVLLSVLLAVICARPLPFFLLLSALLFSNHRKPAMCSTAPRTATT